MRERKFRVWHLKRKYFLPITEDSDYLISMSESGFIMINNGNSVSSNDLVWQQFTGLHDRNGKEIYEGDIVNVDNSEPEENGEYDVTTTCVWETGQFLLMDQAGGSWTRQLYHQSHRLTMIGNIYENPELLKQ